MTDAAAPFLLDRIRLRHYRSIASCDVRLGRLALLVGPNGAGKSNLLDALRLVAESLQTSLDHALRDRGGIGEVRRRSTGHPTHLGITLDFRAGLLSGTYGFHVAAVRGGDYRISQEECQIRDGQADSSFRLRDGVLVEHSEAVMPPTSTDRLYLVAAAGLHRFRPVFDGLVGLSVFSLSPAAMRHLQRPDSGELFRRDGANIAGVLERLQREQPDVKLRVEEYLQRVVPDVQGADRVALGAYETIRFRQRVAGSSKPWQFQVLSMSDGTLRALGVLVALFAGPLQLRSPIGIAEPEAALHPAAAGVLLDAMRDASERRQVIATSHSPDLLDTSSLTAGDLLAVRSIDGITQIGPLDAGGQLALRDHLFTAGELPRADQLIPERATHPPREPAR